MTQPRLKITNLHIRGLGPIRALDLPEQGLGWDGNFPDVLLLGGTNGSGKTTLLEFIFSALAIFDEEDFFKYAGGSKDPFDDPFVVPRSLSAEGASFTLLVECDDFTNWTVEPPGAHQTLRFVTGQVPPGPASYGFSGSGGIGSGQTASTLAAIIKKANSSFPRVIYLPSDRRASSFPKKSKMFSETEEDRRFAQRWKQPSRWEESLEALLYSARWKDLNLKEEGRPEEATHFANYAKAFSDFWGNTKDLAWNAGELFIEIKSTKEQHPLSALSSGEKQIMVMVSELLRGWRPGSLILIDEPELHLHTAWQTRLWELLVRWQRERGGQVIVATQSNHLFRIADPASVALLGRDPL